MSLESLLQLMADGNFHSGEELGNELHVSRAAVWKKVQGLEGLGLEIQSVKGKGYRILGGVDLLDKAVIEDALIPPLSDIHVVMSIDSTNKYLMERCFEGRGHKSLCLAERQVAGRGRRGKTWISPFGRNLYFSLGWEFTQGAQALEGLSLAVGVCLARVLTSKGISDTGLKWPNDVLVKGKKVAGVLIEMTGDAAGVCQVVIGIGLNVAMDSVKLIEEIKQPWTDVTKEFGGRVERSELLVEIVEELISMLADYQYKGFETYRKEWQGYDICFNQPVSLSTPVTEVSGIARGVTNTGAIKIEGVAGCETYSGGEISLRLA